MNESGRSRASPGQASDATRSLAAVRVKSPSSRTSSRARWRWARPFHTRTNMAERLVRVCTSETLLAPDWQSTTELSDMINARTDR